MRLASIIISLAVIAACSASTPARPAGITGPGGFTVEVFATGFDGPTQMVSVGDTLIVAELNGEENDGTGRILRVSSSDPTDRTVLQAELDKPTGVAVVGDRLWIMERKRLSFTSLEPDDTRTVVVDEMPSNGRSQGTLTATVDGGLLYNTSGSKRGATRVAGSGTLFAIADATGDNFEPEIVATGFKHAYAHLFDQDGQLWSVEMTDGRFDDERAPDELVAVTPGDDAGWPQCVGDNRAVAEFGGTAQLCADSPTSHAIFDVGATPTSLVLAPWNDDVFVVALWVPGQVVTVPRSQPEETPHEPELLLDGIESPQHLLPLDGALLVSDHATGQIFKVTPAP